MPLTFEESDGNIVRVTASGKLTEDDYDAFVPRMEELIERWGRLRMLFQLVDFRGWDLASAWDEMRFQAKHRKHLKRVAVVGEKSWEKWASGMSRFFTGADVRFFEHDDAAGAVGWIESGW